jgi:hypothetical protein
MPKIYYIVTMAVLLVSTALFTSFVFIPTINPYEVVSVEAELIPEIVQEEEEQLPTLFELLAMEENSTKIMKAEILNRQLPQNWSEKQTYFKYTYIGQYSPQAQELLDALLLDEYKWQKQLDEEGNVVMGGIILSKDGTYQLHTHNTFTKGERFFLLGDLLDRFHNEELKGTQIKLGNVILENIWERDIRIREGGMVPYADLIVSTCLERYGDRRLISGWNIVRE